MDAELKRLARELLALINAADDDAETPGVSLQDTLTELSALSDARKVTVDQYKRGLRYFEIYLGKPATSNDLTHDNLNGFFAWLQSHRNCGPITVRSYRGSLCRIWNFLAQDGVIQPYLIRKLRIPKVRHKPVECWNKDQVKQLLQACEAFRGNMRLGIPKRHFFRALLLVAYDSGLRPVDLKLLEWKNIDFKRSIAVIVQHKTGNTHCFKLSQDAIEAVKKIVEPRRDRVFPSGRDGLHKQLRRLYRIAERFGFTRKKGQSLAQLRKVHATEIYKKHGLAAAAESLGHVSGSALAKRHYVDATAQHIGNLPPSLE